MPIITLTTDYGFQSHQLVKLKARLLRNINGVQLVDIMHNALPFHKDEAVFMLKNTMFDFPDNTIHFMTIGAQNTSNMKYIVAKCRNQFLICPDDGFAGRLLGDYLEAEYYHIAIDSDPNVDIVREIYCGVAELFQENGFNIDAPHFKQMEGMIITSSQKIVKHQYSMIVPISYVDYFGNAYSNLTKKELEEFANGQKFEIRISRDEWITKISRDFSEVRRGDPLARFGEEDQLQIAINGGDASKLFNLKKGNQFIIEINAKNSEIDV